MASIDTLSALFHAIAKGDLDTALTVASKIAKQENERGHHSAAQALRGSLNPNGHSLAVHGRPESQMSTPLGLLIPEQEGPLLADVMLRPEAKKALLSVISEWKHQKKLQQNGIRRRSTMLFWGPPGCGKTYTARSLGRELSLPVLTARLSSVVGAYLGQTGANLRQLFAFAKSNRCILLLDEFDALGRSRGRREDVGELDRVVISMLQELDHSLPAGLVIAATNLKESLDPALWRRFDLNIQFPSPTKKEILKYSGQLLKRSQVMRTEKLLKNLATKKTYADVDREVENHRRDIILNKA
ncbi:MAG TPA: ATP-binding protein [Myxococcota bacterium]|nr:ATP-binding protein [Myxococcota bacterium]